MKFWLVVIRAIGGLLISASAVAAAYQASRNDRRRY